MKQKRKTYYNGYLNNWFSFLSYSPRYTLYLIRENWFLFSLKFYCRANHPESNRLFSTMRIVLICNDLILILAVLLTLISCIDIVLVTPIVGGYAPNNCGTKFSFPTHTERHIKKLNCEKRLFNLPFQINSNFLCHCFFEIRPMEKLNINIFAAEPI